VPVAQLSEHDAGNGAAMRVLPVALATLDLSEAEVQAAVRAQAHVTHHNPVSDAAAEFLALTVQDALRGAALRDIYRRRIKPLVETVPAFAYRQRRRENPSGWIVETMQAVLQSLLDTGNFEDCLIDVVNRGGDADTTGAIAGMLAGALYGRSALPGRWLRALDATARERCVAQSRQLLAFCRRR
jgi:ADP-ribosyl-[dinitrogen reductase] hydrolase